MRKIRWNRFHGDSTDKIAHKENNSIFSIICRTISNNFEPEEILSWLYIVRKKSWDT